MAKLTLSDPSSLANEQSFLSTIASNNALIEAAVETTLSRDGTSPNTMSADLDMNSNNILNLPSPATDAEPVTLGYLTSALEDVEGVGFAFASVTAETPVVGDYLVFGDVSDSEATKKATITDVLALAAATSGDVVGPASSTDNAAVRFDSTTGKLIQNSGVIIDDSNNVSGVAALSATTIELGHASDTTLSRTGAGAIAVEGVGVALNSTSATHTAGTIELGAATDTTLSRASAGVLAVEGVNVLTTATGLAQGKHSIWIPAAAWKPRAANGCGTSTYDSGASDVTILTLDFDTTTQEYAHTVLAMPKSWNENTITYRVLWTNTAGSAAQTYAPTLAGRALSDDDAINGAFGTAVTASDTWLAQNDLHITAESSAVTIGNTPAEGDLVWLELSRDVATDNMTGDANVIGVMIFLTNNASTDA